MNEDLAFVAFKIGKRLAQIERDLDKLEDLGALRKCFLECADLCSQAEKLLGEEVAS